MSFVTGVSSTIAGLERAQTIVTLALDEALEKEARGVLPVARALLAPSGAGSVSREIADAGFVARPNEVGEIKQTSLSGALQETPGIAISKSGTQQTAWVAGFDHAAAHTVHGRGRTKNFLSRALKMRERGMPRRIEAVTNRRLAQSFPRTVA